MNDDTLNDLMADAPLASELWFAVAETRARMRKAVDADRVLGPLALTLRTYTILSLACMEKQLSQREIGDLLFNDPRQMVNLVDELEGLEYITRDPHPRDRRIKVVSPTQEGLRVCGEARRLLAEREEASLVVPQGKEREQLLSLLAAIQPRKA